MAADPQHNFSVEAERAIEAIYDNFKLEKTLQVGENYCYMFNLGPNICKC